MPNWTKKNFHDLDDRSPPDAPDAVAIRAHALSSRELGISRFTYEPGPRMPFGHRHRALVDKEQACLAGHARRSLRTRSRHFA